MLNTIQLYEIFQQYPEITTDTRIIKPNSIFFALKGEHFDANQFASKALSQGCAYAVVDDPSVVADERFLLVDHVLNALQALAKHHRKVLNTKIIGVTGTNGKTTTKELIYAVLSKKYHTVATQGNLNNHIGVPLTLLSMTEETEIAIVEMGANHPGEIAELCEMAMPDYGVITNIGKAHLEGFGTFEHIIRTKSALYDAVKANNGTVFVNADNPLLMDLAQGCNQKTYGMHQADCIGEIIKTDPRISLKFDNEEIHTHLTGIYNVENILAAACIGRFFNLSEPHIKIGLESYYPNNNRSQIVRFDKMTVIMDAYNANPTSMHAAIESFSQLQARNKFLILGDMLELGDYSEEEHQAIIQLLESKHLEEYALVGKHFSKTRTQNIPKFETVEQAADFLKHYPLNGYTILLKGSRGIKLEKILDILKK